MQSKKDNQNAQKYIQRTHEPQPKTMNEINKKIKQKMKNQISGTKTRTWGAKPMCEFHPKQKWSLTIGEASVGRFEFKIGTQFSIYSNYTIENFRGLIFSIVCAQKIPWFTPGQIEN